MYIGGSEFFLKVEKKYTNIQEIINLRKSQHNRNFVNIMLKFMKIFGGDHK